MVRQSAFFQVSSEAVHIAGLPFLFSAALKFLTLQLQEVLS